MAVNRFFRSVSVALTFVLAVGCLTAVPAVSGKPAKKAAGDVLSQDLLAVHVLNRLGYGARPGDIERVKAMGVAKYINSQLHPEKIADTALAQRLSGLKTIRMSQTDLLAVEQEARELRRDLVKSGAKEGETGRLDPSTIPAEKRKALREKAASGTTPRNVVAELQQAKVLRATYSDRQLEEVLTDFWFNHFNVYANKGLDRVFLTAYERDVIRPNVFGKFHDLLNATAESPAMLFYLDNWQSVAPGTQIPNRRTETQRPRTGDSGGGVFGRGGGIFGQTRRQDMERQAEKARRRQEAENQAPAKQPKRTLGLNENYARELMELHTLGVDGGYTQKDVTEVARCFTGWSIKRPYAALMGNRDGGDTGVFVFNDFAHDKGEKTVLGKTIKGGGKDEGERILDMLARHPSTAKFIATKLVRRFVSDVPPPALVDAVADTFLKTDGDLRSVYLKIFESKEFFAQSAYRAKVKTPFELVVSSLRATDADVNSAIAATRVLERLGMPLYGCQPPTGYPDSADHWVNTGALLGRLNYGLALAGNKLPGVAVQLDKLVKPGGKLPDALDTLTKSFLNGDVTPQTRDTLLEKCEQLGEGTRTAKTEPAAAPINNRMARRENRPDAMAGPDTLADLLQSGPPSSSIAQLSGLILGSPEFQKK